MPSLNFKSLNFFNLINLFFTASKGGFLMKNPKKKGGEKNE